MRLYLMRLGSLRGGNAPIPAYLIQTDDGRNVLVDTGFPRSFVGAHRQDDKSPVIMDERDTALAQLAEISLGVGDIHAVIGTHFDIDHAGNYADFAQATFVVQRAHYQLALDGHQRFARSRGSWGAEGLRYQLVDGDTEWAEGITLLETSGHVPGHQSVLVRLPHTGPVLLAIDAISSAALLAYPPEERPLTPFDMDADDVRRSTRKLVDLAQREGVALLVHGHDDAQWQGLRLIPDCYE